MRINHFAFLEIVLKPVLFAFMLSGCSLSLGAGAPQYYQLVKQNSPVAAPQTVAASLLVRDVEAGGFLRSHKIIYTDDAAQPAFYRYASWSETPTQQLTDLLRQSLSERRYFAYVTGQSSGARADYQLTTTLLDMRHDTSSKPGVAVIELRAELVGLNTREVIAAQVFRETAPVSDFTSEAAVAGLNAAAAALTNSITQWVEVHVLTATDSH